MKNFLALIITAAVAACAFYLFWLPWVPELKTYNPSRTALMDLRKAQARKKGKELQESMVWRDLGEISPNLREAVLLAEDDVFYIHHGFDPEQIKIALKMNWEKKRYAYGGSTITQQLARTLYLTPHKHLLRKIKEAILTAWIEQALGKNRILEIYLNVVEWGDGIYGAEAAARRYYQKGAGDLSARESVALASVLPSPRKWSPLKETAFMKRRRENILSRMRKPEEKLPPQAKEKQAEELTNEIPKSAENEGP